MNEKECRRIVNERAEGCCEYCGLWGTTLDHRLPRSQGGLWEPCNIFALCGDGTRGHHGEKEHHPQWAAELGLRVWSYQNPAEVPVMRRGQLVLLDNEGGYTLA